MLEQPVSAGLPFSIFLPFHSVSLSRLETGQWTGWALGPGPQVCIWFPHLQSCLQPSIRVPGYEPPVTCHLSSPEPYTCGACGIQFQFYSNLLEHMQSHAGKAKGTQTYKWKRPAEPSLSTHPSPSQHTHNAVTSWAPTL